MSIPICVSYKSERKIRKSVLGKFSREYYYVKWKTSSLEGCLISSVMGTFNLVFEEWVWFQEEITYTTFTRELYFRGMLK